MKFSKKVFIPILILLIICGIFGVTRLTTSKYPLPNIKSSEIKGMTIYHKKNPTIVTANKSKGNQLLKIVKDITKNSTFEENDGEYIYDDFLSTVSLKKPDNYYIEIPFSRTEELNLNGTSIKTDTLVIDISENAFYYHNMDSYTLKKLDVKDGDYDKLSKFLNSNY